MKLFLPTSAALCCLLLLGCSPQSNSDATLPATSAGSDTTATPPPPGTDIYLVDLHLRDGHLQAGTPENITSREGYDNQPHFLPDGGSILYTSSRQGQTDIYRYELQARTSTLMAATAESEYSPTPMPDGERYSVVRVELDTVTIQRLWAFPLAGGEPTLLLPAINPVGYHVWIDADLTGLFVLGNPITLQLADLRSGTGQVVADSIGRCLQRVPQRQAISFVDKSNENEWWVCELDIQSGAIERLVATPAGSEDYAWLPDGSLVMAQGSTLFRWHSASQSSWQEIADFAAAGVEGISRLAVSPDGTRLALVASD